MKKFFLIVFAVATMGFAQGVFHHGMSFGLGFVAVSGSGSDHGIYERTGGLGMDMMFGWNFLFPIEQSIYFHTGTELNAYFFEEDHDSDEYWTDVWKTEFRVPLAIRSYWDAVYLELGARFNVHLWSEWTYNNYNDDEIASGSCDDFYQHYHVGLLAALGLMLEKVDLNMTVVYDLNPATKDLGFGETKNIVIDFGIIFWFGGQK